MKKTVFAIALSLASAVSWGQTTSPETAAAKSPVGLWKTIDDATKQPRSLVRIVEVNGTLQGKIEKVLLREGEKEGGICDKCKDERKDKPVVGLQIMQGYKVDGSDANKWVSGEILDPNNGKVYKSHVTVQDGGSKLAVRGYIGTPLLGRTQTWLREAP